MPQAGGQVGPTLYIGTAAYYKSSDAKAMDSILSPGMASTFPTMPTWASGTISAEIHGDNSAGTIFDDIFAKILAVTVKHC